jgi:hypothetical protein
MQSVPAKDGQREILPSRTPLLWMALCLIGEILAPVIWKNLNDYSKFSLAESQEAEAERSGRWPVRR